MRTNHYRLTFGLNKAFTYIVVATSEKQAIKKATDKMRTSDIYNYRVVSGELLIKISDVLDN